MVKVVATPQLKVALEKVRDLDISKPTYGIHNKLRLLHNDSVNVLFVQEAYEKYRQIRYQHPGTGNRQYCRTEIHAQVIKDFSEENPDNPDSLFIDYDGDNTAKLTDYYYNLLILAFRLRDYIFTGHTGNVINNLLKVYQYPEENQALFDIANYPGRASTPARQSGAQVETPNATAIAHRTSADSGASAIAPSDQSEPSDSEGDNSEIDGDTDSQIDGDNDSIDRSGTADLHLQLIDDSIMASNKVPATYEKAHCDPNAVPGSDATEIDNYTLELIQPDQTTAAKECYTEIGAAIYVANDKKDIFDMKLMALQPLWAEQASAFKSLLKMSLDATKQVQIGTMTEKEKFEYFTANNMIRALVKVNMNIQQQAKTLYEFVYIDSLAPFQLFIRDLSRKVDASLPRWERWTNMRRGAGQYIQSRDGTLRMANETVDPSDLYTSTMDNTGNENTNVAFNATLNKRKLPAIQLKTFSGKSCDFLRWKSDWKQYFLKHHKEGVIDYYMMMSYLQQSMPSDYKSEMQNLSWDERGYHSWMTELENRHGNKVYLGLEYRKLMQALPRPKDDLASFAEFRRGVVKYVNGLELAGVNCKDTIDSESDQWLSYLAPKLSEKQKTLWNQYKSMLQIAQPDVFTIKSQFSYFYDWLLKHETTLREDHTQTQLMNANPYTKSKDKRGKKHSHVTRTNVTTTNVTALGTRGNPKKPGKKSNQKKRGGNKNHGGGNPGGGKQNCCFCEGNHFSGSCTVPIDKDKAYEKVFVRKLCAICLKPNHKAPECRKYGTQPCDRKTHTGERCGGNHNSILHGCQPKHKSGPGKSTSKKRAKNSMP